MDLVQGYAIWCHYTASDDSLIQAYWRTFGTPVLALSERGGLRVEGDHLAACGSEPAFRLDTEWNRSVKPYLRSAVADRKW